MRFHCTKNEVFREGFLHEGMRKLALVFKIRFNF